MIPSKLLSSGSLRLWFTALRFVFSRWQNETGLLKSILALTLACLPDFQLSLIAFRYELYADSLVLIVHDTLHGALFI